MRVLLFIFSIVCLMLCGPFVVMAGDNSDVQTEGVVKVGIGESKKIPFDGINPFVADEEIAVLKEVLTNTVVISGKVPGTTNLFYWKEGTLTSITIEVTVPEIFGTALSTPQFLPNRPYFEYFFSNASSFSKNTFYDSASYLHNLSAMFPFSSGATVRTIGTFNHSAGGDKSLSSVGLIYQDRRLKLDLGQTSASLSQALSRFTGYSLIGSKFEYKLPTKNKTSHQIHAFAGSTIPTDYFDASFNDEKLYGAHYAITRSRSDSLFPDFFNANFISYELEDTSSLRYAGIADASLHFNKNLSFGTGYAQDPGGFTTVFNPRLESKSGLTEAKYTFIKHGIHEFGSDVELEDRHEYTINSQHMLKDERTLLEGNLSQEFVLPMAASTAAKSNILTAGLGYSKRFSFKKSYGANYRLTRSVEDAETTLSNSLGVSLTQPLFKKSYLFHNIGYARSDLAQNTNVINLLTSFNSESESLRYSSILSGYLSRGSFVNESMSLSNIVEWSLKNAIISGNFAYQKSSFRDGNHQFLFSPSINYQPTAVDLFALNGGVSLLLNGSTQITGSIGLQYRRLFGPGVASDSLIKRVLKGGQKSTVDGDVFLDKNYNTILDSDDQQLTNLAVKLDDKKTVTTDDKGHFIFKQVKAGEHVLSIDAAALNSREDIEAKELEKVTTQSFVSTGTYPITLPLPMEYKSAKLIYKFVLDVNDNHKVDDADKFVSIKKIHSQRAHGEKREFSTKMRGNMIQGLEPGAHKVWIDFLDIPENVESLSPLTQTIFIKKNAEQTVTYFFKPIRFLRGQIKTNTSSLPGGLKVKLGPYVSRVDSKGYYWLKDLKPGDFDLLLEGLPHKLCMIAGTNTKLTIPSESFTATQDIFLTAECP